MDEIKLIIATNISYLRNSVGLTQADLALKLNYSDKAVSKWERGESVPDISVLKNIADIFGVTVDYLITTHIENEIDAEEYRKRENNLRKSRRMILLVSVLGIFALDLLIFIIFWLLGNPTPIIFVAAMPVALITALVLHSCFEHGKYNLLIVSLLITSIILLVYLIFKMYLHQNFWQIFLLILPAELITVFGFRIKKQK